jgi:peptide/nickel transport system ATP-binding protein
MKGEVIMELQDKSLLSVKDLTLAFQSKHAITEVVHGVSFTVNEGEIIGIVGESGSGKSVTALSILSLLAAQGRVTLGEVKFDNRILSLMSEKELEKIRGKEISYVFQEPMTSLNPVLTIGYQMEEMLLLHEKLSKEDRKQRILEMFEAVELHDGEQILKKYPHQLSGGMRQRVMIAMAMICRPRLLIADEPTTALDVTVQIKILELLRKLNKEFHTSIILISHDLAVIRSICSRVMVMYQGNIVEQGTVEEIFTNPEQDYTQKLLEAALLAHTDSDMLRACSYSEPKETNKEESLRVDDLCVFYPETKLKLFGKKSKKEIVHHVSLTMKKGEILGIVGESGCGKSTMAKALAGLVKDTSGTIHMNCKQPQMVFQDPYSSLNPAKKIGWLLEEPLLLSKRYSKQERKDKVEEMLYKVGLTSEYANQYPANLSGGQRQRVAIAMAIMLNQEFIILDEPVSALDVTVQEQILELLLYLRKEYDLTYLFISHDMGVIQKICDRVGVMYQGELIELRETKELFEQPKQEYTKKLLEAVLR